MHILAKLLDFLLNPLAWTLLLVGIAWLQAHRRPQHLRPWLAAALAVALLSGWQALPEWLLNTLERQYTEWSPEASTEGYAGVVVLGGALSAGYLAQQHLQPGLNDAAERMTAAVALLRRNPRLHLVFTGGEGAAFGTGPSEAARAAAFFATLGVPPNALLLEDRSRNTYENAVLTGQMPDIDRGRPWLLLTSAWHMPRAMRVFQAQGWNVTAYPVDFRTVENPPWARFSLTEGPAIWQLALHEWVGLLAYRLLGRSGG